MGSFLIKHKNTLPLTKICNHVYVFEVDRCVYALLNLKEGTDTEICRELCVSLGLTARDA